MVIFLYLFLFHFLLYLAPFLSQYKRKATVVLTDSKDEHFSVILRHASLTHCHTFERQQVNWRLWIAEYTAKCTRVEARMSVAKQHCPQVMGAEQRRPGPGLRPRRGVCAGGLRPRLGVNTGVPPLSSTTRCVGVDIFVVRDSESVNSRRRNSQRRTGNAFWFGRHPSASKRATGCLNLSACHLEAIK